MASLLHPSPFSPLRRPVLQGWVDQRVHREPIRNVGPHPHRYDDADEASSGPFVWVFCVQACALPCFACLWYRVHAIVRPFLISGGTTVWRHREMAGRGQGPAVTLRRFCRGRRRRSRGVKNSSMLGTTNPPYSTRAKRSPKVLALSPVTMPVAVQLVIGKGKKR